MAPGVRATIRHLKESRLERWFALFILACGLPGVVSGALIILKFDDQVSKLALGTLTTIPGGSVLFTIGTLNDSLTSGNGLFVTLSLAGWFGLECTLAGCTHCRFTAGAIPLPTFRLYRNQ